MRHSFVYSLAATIGLLLTPSVHASTAYSALATHWQFVQETDEILQVPVCRAFTTQTDSAEPVEVSVSFPQDGKTLPMIRVKTKLQADEILTGSQGPVLLLLKSDYDGAGTNVYWYSPKDFPGFENQMREANTLTLQFHQQTALELPTVTVSLSGSNNALNQAEACLKGLKEPTAFWKLLNGPTGDVQGSLGDGTSLFLLQTTQGAYNDYLTVQTNQAAIAKLQRPFANLLQKEAAALKAVNADQAALTKAQADLDSLNSQIAKTTAQISKEQTELATFQSQKPGADSDLQAKQAIDRPLLQQMVPYQKALDAAHVALGIARVNLQLLQGKIVGAQRRIEDDNAEQRNLTTELPQLRQNVSDATAARQRAESDANGFSYQNDYQNILSNDYQYQQDQSVIASTQADIQSTQSSLNRDENSLRSDEQILAACQQQHPNESYQCDSFNVDVDRQHLQSDRERLNNDYTTLAGTRANLQACLQNDQAKAASDQSYYQGQLQQAYDIENDAQNELNDALSRIAEIPAEIANLQSEITGLRSEIPGLQQAVTDAQATEAQAQSAFDQYAKQIGFDVADQNYQAALRLDQQIDSGIQSNTTDLPKQQALLKRQQGQMSGDQKSLQQAQVSLTAAQAKLAPIETQLQPYHAQVDPLQTLVDQANTDFGVQRASYQDLARQLGAD